MPDFDTRRPQEPDRPSRLHLFVVASKQHISAVGRSIARTMMRHWRPGLSISFLAVLAGILTAWAGHYVETHSEQVDQKLDWAVETPREQLGQEIKLPSTPEYALYYKSSTLSGGASAAAECELSDEGHYDGYACEDVFTKVTDPVKLASITEELRSDPNSGSFVAEAAAGDYIDVMKTSFYRSEQVLINGDTQATSYCFETEELAADGLRSQTDDVHKLVLAGQTDNCNLIVYEIVSPNP